LKRIFHGYNRVGRQDADLALAMKLSPGSDGLLSLGNPSGVVAGKGRRAVQNYFGSRNGRNGNTQRSQRFSSTG
jgi:hypothetical protein